MAKPEPKKTEEKTEKKTEQSKEKIKTPIGILTWAAIYKPDTPKFNDQKGETKEPKFKATVIYTKEKDAVKGVACEADLKPLKQFAFKAAQAKFGKDVKYSELETPFNDGDDYIAGKEKDKQEKYQYLAERIFFTAKSKFKPGIINAELKPLEGEENVASGDYVRLSLTAYAYEREAQDVVKGKKVKKTIRGVSFSLENVQKVHQGKRFEGERDAAGDFDEVKNVEFDDDEELDEGAGDTDADIDDSEFENAEGDEEEIV